jgi:hypothetical protein
MGLLGDITQFSGLSLLKKATKKKDKPAETPMPFRAKRPAAAVIDPAKVIETEDPTKLTDSFSDGFSTQADRIAAEERKRRRR